MVCCVVVVLSNCLNAERFLLWRIGGLFAGRPLHTPYIVTPNCESGFAKIVGCVQRAVVKIAYWSRSQFAPTHPILSQPYRPRNTPRAHQILIHQNRRPIFGLLPTQGNCRMVCCVVVVLSNCLNAERFLLWRIGGLFAARPLHTPYIAWLKATTGVNPAMVFETVVARPKLSRVKLIVVAGSENEATSPALLSVVEMVCDVVPLKAVAASPKTCVMFVLAFAPLNVIVKFPAEPVVVKFPAPVSVPKSFPLKGELVHFAKSKTSKLQYSLTWGGISLCPRQTRMNEKLPLCVVNHLRIRVFLANFRAAIRILFEYLFHRRNED
jgi:hypothetical protein